MIYTLLKVCTVFTINNNNIIHNVFLFQPASANLIVYFLLKPMGVCFFITGQLFHVLNFRFITHLRVTVTSFVISANLDDPEAIKLHTKQPLRSGYCIINYPNFLNISAGIPIAC